MMQVMKWVKGKMEGMVLIKTEQEKEMVVLVVVIMEDILHVIPE